MKYIRLTQDELKELESEFVTFLASAQITGSDWEKMKVENPTDAEEMIEVFSDVVYDKAMSKIEYVENLTPKVVTVFHFEKNKAFLVGLKVKEGSSVDLSVNDYNIKWDDKMATEVSLIRQEKVYTKERGEEVFDLLKKGCFVANEKLFNALSTLG